MCGCNMRSSCHHSNRRGTSVHLIRRGDIAQGIIVSSLPSNRFKDKAHLSFDLSHRHPASRWRAMPCRKNRPTPLKQMLDDGPATTHYMADGWLRSLMSEISRRVQDTDLGQQMLIISITEPCSTSRHALKVITEEELLGHMGPLMTACYGLQ